MAAQPYPEDDLFADAATLQEAANTLREFAAAVAARKLDPSSDPLGAVRWAAGQLWIMSDDCHAGIVPDLIRKMDSDKGVSASKLAELVPAFLRRMADQLEELRPIKPTPAKEAIQPEPDGWEPPF